MIAIPDDGELLGSLSFFTVDAIVLDPFDGHQLLDTIRFFVRRDGMIFADSSQMYFFGC